MTVPKTGVTVIITRSVGDGWFADAFGPQGAALNHQPQVTYATPQAAERAVRALYGDALVSVRTWCPERGYGEVA